VDSATVFTVLGYVVKSQYVVVAFWVFFILLRSYVPTIGPVFVLWRKEESASVTELTLYMAGNQILCHFFFLPEHENRPDWHNNVI